MFSTVDIVVAVAAVTVALLMFFVGTSVDEDYHPLLEFVKEILERHGFACLSDLLFVLDPKLRGVAQWVQKYDLCTLRGRGRWAPNIPFLKDLFHVYAIL